MVPSPVPVAERVPPRARRAGFTLIEVLIVVAILGIVATLAFPAVERSVMVSKANRAAFVLGNDLQQAYTLAARQRKPVRFVINTAQLRTETQDRASSAVLVSRYYGPTNSPFGLTAMTTTAANVVIFPNGIGSSALTVTVSVGQNTRTVTMSRVGQVRIQ